MGVLSRSFHGSLHGSLYMEVWMFISPSCKAEWWGTLWNFPLFKRLPIPTYLQINVLQTPPNLHIYLQTLLRKRLPSPHTIGLRASLAWRNHWAYFKPGEGTGVMICRKASHKGCRSHFLISNQSGYIRRANKHRSSICQRTNKYYSSIRR